MQLLAKFKKILSMGFRATLNFENLRWLSLVSMSKNSRNTSTGQTSNGEVKNYSYASGCFLTVANKNRTNCKTLV